MFSARVVISSAPQSGIADAEIKDRTVENPELKGSLFIASSRSVSSHARFTYCRDSFLANFYPPGPFTCIFPKTSFEVFLC